MNGPSGSWPECFSHARQKSLGFGGLRVWGFRV